MLDYKLAKVFPKPTISAGYVLIALGLFYMLFQPLAILISLIGIFVSFSYNGIQLDPAQERYRSYSNIFSFKFGRWQDLDAYPDLCIMTRKGAYRAYSYSMTSTTNESQYYGLFLLSKNHRQKLEIQRHGEKSEAIRAAKDIAKILKLNYVKYQPPARPKRITGRGYRSHA